MCRTLETEAVTVVSVKGGLNFVDNEIDDKGGSSTRPKHGRAPYSSDVSPAAQDVVTAPYIVVKSQRSRSRQKISEPSYRHQSEPYPFDHPTLHGAEHQPWPQENDAQTALETSNEDPNGIIGQEAHEQDAPDLVQNITAAALFKLEKYPCKDSTKKEPMIDSKESLQQELIRETSIDKAKKRKLQEDDSGQAPKTRSKRRKLYNGVNHPFVIQPSIHKQTAMVEPQGLWLDASLMHSKYRGQIAQSALFEND